MNGNHKSPSIVYIVKYRRKGDGNTYCGGEFTDRRLMQEACVSLEQDGETIAWWEEQRSE